MNDSFLTFIYFDPRYNDTYHVTLDEDGSFVSALRYTSPLRPPVLYSHIGDIPQPHRTEISNRVAARLPSSH